VTTDVTAPTGGSSIDAATSLGAVALTVADLGRARAFYEHVLGLVASARGADSVGLTASGGGSELVVLHEDRQAPPFDPRGNGLFHLALLVGSRAELACSLRRIADARWRLTGASDHLVSEALYLRDPDGNGIEIYRDRPRTQWPLDGGGTVRMDTLGLDLSDLLGEPDGNAGSQPATAVAAGARIGHVHLQVADLAAAERFYCDVLGFDVTVRGYPGALFVSAGGYHHHIGLNTWQSLGAAPVVPGRVGLCSFEVLVPDQAALAQVLDRARVAEVDVEHLDGGPASPGAPAAVRVRDPFGTAIVLRCA
jgi:catechol 2,3-dioxygenase